MWEWLGPAIEVVTEFGPRAHDYIRSRGAAILRDDFVEEYQNHLGKSISVIIELDRNSSEGAIKMLLQTIAVVVEAAYLQEQAKTPNANYMVPQATANVPRDTIRFAGGRDLSTFPCALTLEMWADDVEGLPKPGEFALPVETGTGEFAQDLLFGAPTAYMNARMANVADTLKVHKTVKNHRASQAVKDYFEKHAERLRSFVSLPITAPPEYSPANGKGRTIAVVNVQSCNKSLFGTSKVSHRRLQLALSPFLLMLSYCIARKHGDQLGVKRNVSEPKAETK